MQASSTSLAAQTEKPSPIDTLATIIRAVHLLDRAVTDEFFPKEGRDRYLKQDEEIKAVQAALCRCSDPVVPEPLATRTVTLIGTLIPELANVSEKGMRWLYAEDRISKWASETQLSHAEKRKKDMTDILDFARSAVESIEQLSILRALL